MLNFRKDLTEYYDFFVAQSQKFLDEMAATNIKNNTQNAELKTRIITTEHKMKDREVEIRELDRRMEDQDKFIKRLSHDFHKSNSIN